MHNRDISAAVDNDSRKIEQAVLDRSAKDERCNILAVGTECDVVCCLVVSCSRRAAHCNDALIDEVVQTDNVAAIWSGVVAECHTTGTIARVKCNKEPHCRILKHCLQHGTPVTKH